MAELQEMMKISEITKQKERMGMLGQVMGQVMGGSSSDLVLASVNYEKVIMEE